MSRLQQQEDERWRRFVDEDLESIIVYDGLGYEITPPVIEETEKEGETGSR